MLESGETQTSDVYDKDCMKEYFFIEFSLAEIRFAGLKECKNAAGLRYRQDQLTRPKKAEHQDKKQGTPIKWLDHISGNKKDQRLTKRWSCVFLQTAGKSLSVLTTVHPEKPGSYSPSEQFKCTEYALMSQ